MSMIKSISVEIKFSILFICIVFQINQGEKSSTQLLINNKVYQWSKVNNSFLTFLNSFIEMYFTEQKFTHFKCTIQWILVNLQNYAVNTIIQF